MVIVLILLTVAALGFLLYRYLCHNKGDYRTTGELAPGEDPDEEYSNKATSEKKEYFIWTWWRLGEKKKRGLWKIERKLDCFFFFFLYLCFEGSLLLAGAWEGIKKQNLFVMKILLWKMQWSTSNAKDKIVIVGVNIDGWEAGDRTTGVLRLAALGVKTGGGIFKMPQLCDHRKLSDNQNVKNLPVCYIIYQPCFRYSLLVFLMLLHSDILYFSPETNLIKDVFWGCYLFILVCV